jgi:integrase
MKERQLEADGKVKFEYNEKGEPLRPKYELITSHTARRSCITNLYLQGRFTNQQIMSISGHKDEKTFKGYIVCSGVAIAERIVEINKGSSNEGLFL